MKQLFLVIVLITAALHEGTAQPSEYQQQMEPLIAKLDNAKTTAHYQSLANDFIRIANAEKSQWLPYYYAAFSNVKVAYLYREDSDKIEPFSVLAASQIAKARSLADREDSVALTEILIVESMVNRSKIFMSPMKNGPKYGPEANRLLEEAKKLSPENPRVLFSTAWVKYYTPKLWGGDKSEAKKMLEAALPKFTVNTKDPLLPRWGKVDCETLLKEYN